MWAITDKERTRFFTFLNHVPQFTDNINVAYIFSSEFEALRYELAINDWLDLECDVLPYIKNVADLYEDENKRVNNILSTHYGLSIMKNFVLSLLLVMAAFGGASAQIVQDANGNFTETATKKKAPARKKEVAVLTGKTFTNSKGVKFDVWKSPRGKYFVNVCPSSGKWYKKYLN